MEGVVALRTAPGAAIIQHDTGNRSNSQQGPIRGVILTFLEATHMLFHNRHVTTLFKPRIVAVFGRPIPQFDQLSPVPRLRERPVDPSIASLLPVAWVEKEATLAKKDAREPPSWGPEPSSNASSRHGAARYSLPRPCECACADTHQIFFQMTGHCLAHSIRVGSVRYTHRNGGRNTPT